MATFCKIRKVAVHLPRLAGWRPKKCKIRKVAVHLPRLAGKVSKSEKWPFTCQGYKVEDQTYFDGGVKNRKVAVHQPRLAGLWPEAHKIRKAAVDQPRLAGWATDRSPATVCRFDPRKKVRFNLLTSAGEWSLFKPATYGRCSQVCTVECTAWNRPISPSMKNIYSISQINDIRIRAIHSSGEE